MSSGSFKNSNLQSIWLQIIYIYIYILNNSPYGKKKNPASDLKMKIYNESLSSGKNMYRGKKKKKKRKGQPCHTN